MLAPTRSAWPSTRNGSANAPASRSATPSASWPSITTLRWVIGCLKAKLSSV
jgi:hypothetical protein